MTRPWGLLAFLMNPETHLLADQLLHAVQTQHPRRKDGVSQILLADTSGRLRRGIV